MNAHLYLGARVRPGTVRRLRFCRNALVALGAPATSDRVLSRSLDNFARALKVELRRRGVSLPGNDHSATAPELTAFRGPISRSPMVDGF